MSRATLDIIGLTGHGVVHGITVSPLTQAELRRLRLRVQVSAVQERRTQQRLQFCDIWWEQVHRTV